MVFPILPQVFKVMIEVVENVVKLSLRLQLCIILARHSMVLSSFESDVWYLDNEASNHMTGTRLMEVLYIEEHARYMRFRSVRRWMYG